MELEKTIEINTLLSLYGKMLNEKQFEVMSSYYFYDNSLSEIANELSITRQAVSDLLKRVVKTLYNFEEKLGLSKKYQVVLGEIAKIEKLDLPNQAINSLNKIKNALEE